MNKEVYKTKIRLNTRNIEYAGAGISYEDIVALIGGNPEQTYTVTFGKRYSGEHGSLTRGESTMVENNMIIEADITNNS